MGSLAPSDTRPDRPEVGSECPLVDIVGVSGATPGRLTASGAPPTKGPGCYSKWISDSFAQRGSGVRSWEWSGPASLRLAPHSAHNPAQSGRHSKVVGSTSASASRAHLRRSTTPSCTYGEERSSV